MTGIILGIAGIIITIIVYFVQRGKRKLKLYLRKQEERFIRNLDFSYSNNEGDLSISYLLMITNEGRLPIKIDSITLQIIEHTTIFFRAFTTKYYSFPLFSINEPIVIRNGDNFEREVINGYYLRHLFIENKIPNGKDIIIEIIDSKDNIYKSNIIPIDIDHLRRDKGDFLVGFVRR